MKELYNKADLTAPKKKPKKKLNQVFVLNKGSKGNNKRGKRGRY